MKKILFASTALVAFAGAAAAEVTVTGAAEMGIVGGNRYATPSNTDGVTQFWTDVDVTFTMSGEADNGLTFGTKVKFEEAQNGIATQEEDDFAVWVAYGNARLDMGDTDGAFDWAMQEMNLAAGSIDDSETEHPGFNGNAGFDGHEDGQIARFTYTFGDFAAALSAEIDDDPNAQAIAPSIDPDSDDDVVWGLGFKYSGDLAGTKVNVGLGYQDQNDFGSLIGLSVDTTLASGFKIGASYSEMDPESNIASDNVTHAAIGFGYEMNALSIGLNYGKFENYDKMSGTYGSSAESDGYGLAVAYDLGGGLAVQFGYGVGDSTTAAGVESDWDSYSLGLAMSF